MTACMTSLMVRGAVFCVIHDSIRVYVLLLVALVVSDVVSDVVMPMLNADLEWKLTYVGSAENDKYDQVLDSVYVGPVAPGQYKFVFQADPPNFGVIPPQDVVGVTIILLTCSYRNQEFLRVGYYVNNEYEDDALKEDPPASPAIEKCVFIIWGGVGYCIGE